MNAEVHKNFINKLTAMHEKSKKSLKDIFSLMFCGTRFDKKNFSLHEFR